MSIYVGNNEAIICKGDFEPAALYKGDIKIAGATEQTFTGSDISIERTYRAAMGVEVTGKTEQNGTPNPDFPQPIKSAKGSVVSEGRNLFNFNRNPEWIYGSTSYIKSAKGIEVKNNGTVNFAFVEYYLNDLQPNTVYTISMNINSLAGKQRIAIASPRNTGGVTIHGYKDYFNYLVFTTPSDVSGLCLLLYSLTGTYVENASVTYSNIQIVKGTYTADTLPPYQPYYTPFTVQSAYPLYAGDKWLVGDKYVLDKAVLVLDGTEDWWSSPYGYMALYKDDAFQSDDISSIMCTHYKGTALNGEWFTLKIACCVRYLNGHPTFCLKDDVNTILPYNQWKSWLAAQYAAGTPVTIVYQRATPLEIADTQQLKSHPRYTHISTVADEGHLIPDTTAKVKTY